MQLTAEGRSDMGRVRPYHKEIFYIDPRSRFFVVASGVGGKERGRLAAEMALEHARDGVAGLLDQPREADPLAERLRLVDGLRAIFNAASEAIYSSRKTDASYMGISAALLVLVAQSGLGLVAHVGHNRLYLVREGRIFQVTEDHTLVQELINRGSLTAVQIPSFPHRHVVSRAIGSKPAVAVDLSVIDLRPTDRYVLCTDGLSDVVDASEIRTVVERHAPGDAATRLVDIANSRSGRANVTALVVRNRGARVDVRSVGTEQKVALLKGIFLFEYLTFQEAARVLTVVREAAYEDGELIFTEGQAGDQLYVVVEGEVEITERGVVLTRVGAGGHFGELGLVSDGVRSATVRSVGASVHLVVQREDFDGLIRSDHALAIKLLWGFIQNATARVRSLSTELAAIRRGEDG